MSAANDLTFEEPGDSAGQAPARSPLITWRALVLLAAVALLWSMVAWFAVEWQLEDRIAESVARQKGEIGQQIVVIGANVDRVFNRLQGIGAVLAADSDVKAALASFGASTTASRLDYELRKAAWTPRADLLALSRHLRAAAADIGVDMIWVTDAAGDCVAASNSETPASFVGTNYADRAYFISAKGGHRGRQFAVGRVTRVPGLFLSAPVFVDGAFMGAVGVKADLPKIASAVNHPGAFVTDELGVIILAADKALEMRALPGAAVHRLSVADRVSRYSRPAFDTHDIGSPAPGGLVRVAGSSQPHIAARLELPQQGITVHIRAPLEEINRLRGDARVNFMLWWLSGLMVLALLFGARAYLARARQYRESIEAKNGLLSSLNRRLANLATVDALTGLHNRRFMDDVLEREVARAQRKQAPLAVLMIDIDRFKPFNDTFGHAGGDAVLRAMATLMRQHVRASDVLCRYGGEEFLIALPEAPLDAARQRAEVLRLAVRAMQVSHEGTALGQVTISLGLAILPQHGTSVAELIAAADTAMYVAKQRGRDRLVVYGEGAQPAPAPVAAIETA